MNHLPLQHFRHLKRLADMRRCSVHEALAFMMKHVAPIEDNWIDERWGHDPRTREVEFAGHSEKAVMAAIQGLPRNIRPITDGPYLDDFDFLPAEQGLLGIEADGVRVYDFEMSTAREEGVFPLVRDLLPSMSIQQFRIYNTFNSQYLRLVREPKMFTMPYRPGPAIDAGCYVGYKALALARFAGEHPVLACELDHQNFDVLQKNIAANPQFRLEAIRAGLSDQRVEMAINTRNSRTMAHSLTSFDTLKEANEPLLKKGNCNLAAAAVKTTLLDDYTRDFDRLSAVHVSVNGHEPEVVRGGIETIRKTDILRVSCPYARDGRMVRDLVIEAFERHGVEVFGISGAAVIAGRARRDYHALPLNGKAASIRPLHIPFVSRLLRRFHQREHSARN